MDSEMSQLIHGYWWLGLIAIILLLLAVNKFILRLFGIVMIPNDSIGIVNKNFVLLGSNKILPDGKIVALQGEAGVQADTLAPGLHFWFWPWQYKINIHGFITVDDGFIGTVEARDGHPLDGGRVLGRKVSCDSFQDARSFLTNNGERGPQIAIIPPGTYRINTELFTVSASKVVEIPDNSIGIITTKEGKPLSRDEIAGREITGHNMYQDGQSFVDSSGFKGLQEQVILAGRYFLNPMFVTVEIKPMTIVPIANVGVVIAYVGAPGQDVTGDAFKHGNLVKMYEKGVWVTPLDPGMYPINTYTHKVEIVPTANVVLNWATGKSEAHKLDEKLSTITVRSSDGFTFNLDVSQIIHIPRNDAPKVIARFGSMANLVTQVLEPTIGNYFRNTAQNSDVIDFLKQRSKRQDEAKASIKLALEDYNVGAVDTLIGDINPPPELMKTLTDRKLAEQERTTYDTQKLAQEVRQNLEQATALADTQARVVDSERKVQIAEFEANAKIKTAEGDAKSKTLNAEADATVTTTVGNAEATKIRAVGTAEADVIKQKIDSMESGNYALIQVAQALGGSKNKFVPEIMVSGGGKDGSTGGTIVEVLLAQLVAKSLEKVSPETSLTDKKGSSPESK